MLQAIREKAQGWIAWAIVILITIPFALWGIQEYLGVGGETVVAEVQGSKISEQALDEQTRRTRESLRANLGTAYRAELFPEAMLRRQALDRMIDEQILQQAAADWGMRGSDQMVVEAIRSERAFQTDGRFDTDLYRTVLRNNALSEAAYEASVRQSMTMQQLQQGIAGSAFATRAQVDAYQRLADQQRTLSYAVIPADSFLASINPDEAAIDAYYQTHQGQYRLPERVKLDYLLLDVAGLAAQIPADTAAVQAWYEQHKDQFVAPEERHLRHILIPVADDEAVAQAKAQALRDQLLAGADFAGLAKAESADPGSAPEGGDLGWVSSGMMVEDFEKAAFALDDGAISEPVKTPFGFHLIQVQGIRGGGDASFDQVADKAIAAYRRSEAERLFFERAERLAELSYENPDNLVQAAETLGLTIRHSDWMDQAGGEGDLSSPKVVSAAFSDDVLAQGHNSEMLELGPEKLLVLRVAEHQVARARDLAEVREQVVQALRVEQAAAAARQAGEAALAEVRAGTALQALAAAKGWQLHTDVVTGRDQSDVPAAVREQAFMLPRPGTGTAQLAGTALASGDYAVLALSSVTDGDPGKLDDTGRKLLASRLASLHGRMDLGGLSVALRDRADVSIMLKAADSGE